MLDGHVRDAERERGDALAERGRAGARAREQRRKIRSLRLHRWWGASWVVHGEREFEWGVGVWDGAPPTCSTSTPSFYPAFLNCQFFCAFSFQAAH